METCIISAFYIIIALGDIKQLRASNITDKIYNHCKDKIFMNKGEEESKIENYIINYIYIIII